MVFVFVYLTAFFDEYLRVKCEFLLICIIAFFANSIAFASSARLCDILKEIRLSHHAEGVDYHQLQKATIDEVTSVTKGFEHISIEAEKGLELLSPLMESGILDDAIIDIVDRLGFKTLKESTGLVEAFSFLPVEEQIEMIDDIFLRLAQLFHGPKSKEQVIQLTELGRKFNLDKRELESLLSLFDNLDLSNVDDIKLGIFSYLSGDTESLLKNIKRKKGYFGRIKKWLGIEKEVSPILVKNKLIRSTLPERTLLERSELRLPSSQKKIFEQILGDVTTVEIREFARRNWEHLSLDETTSILNEIKKRRVSPNDKLTLALNERIRIFNEDIEKLNNLKTVWERERQEQRKLEKAITILSRSYLDDEEVLIDVLSPASRDIYHDAWEKFLKPMSRRSEIQLRLSQINTMPEFFKYKGPTFSRVDEMLKIDNFEEMEGALRFFLEEIREKVSTKEFTSLYSRFIQGLGVKLSKYEDKVGIYTKFYDIFFEESENYIFSQILKANYDRATQSGTKNIKKSPSENLQFNLNPFRPMTPQRAKQIIEETYLEEESFNAEKTLLYDTLNREAERLYESYLVDGKSAEEVLSETKAIYEETLSNSSVSFGDILEFQEKIKASLSIMGEGSKGEVLLPENFGVGEFEAHIPFRPEGEIEVKPELEEGMRPKVESESLEERRRRARASQRSRN